LVITGSKHCNCYRGRYPVNAFLFSNIYILIFFLVFINSAAESSHLRHHASLALVRLTEVEKYGAQLTITKFEKLALVAQDSCFIVRREFVQYIITQLTSEQLHCRYSAALFLLAYEPEAALVKQVKKFTHDYLLVPGREKMLSVVLTHLIHLVAHHPDFSVGIEELDHFSQYFKYFIACVVTSTNVSLLYHTAQRIKISSDTVNESLSQASIYKKRERAIFIYSFL
jgi:sister-chromatid-cohesion protein PDS5